MTENEHDMTLVDAAALLHVHPETARKWARHKGLPSVKPGRARMFSRREVLAWQDKQRDAPAPADPPPASEPPKEPGTG